MSGGVESAGNERFAVAGLPAGGDYKCAVVEFRVFAKSYAAFIVILKFRVSAAVAVDFDSPFVGIESLGVKIVAPDKGISVSIRLLSFI